MERSGATAGAVSRASVLSPADVLDLQRTAGNRAVTEAIAGGGGGVALQRLQTINQLAPPRATAKQALLLYIRYLHRESLRYEGTVAIQNALTTVEGLVTGVAAPTASQIQHWREIWIDPAAAEIRAMEEVAPVEIDEEDGEPKVDSDVTATYDPTLGCVLQSLERHGKLGMSAAAYHAQMWRDDDPLKYYDTDEAISPLYARFRLTKAEWGGKYKDLVADLAVGKYIFNVASPAGPNGHMFAIEVRMTGGGKSRKVGVEAQDPANNVAVSQGNIISRYWS